MDSSRDHLSPPQLQGNRANRISMLIFAAVITAILAVLILPAFSSFRFKGRMAGQLCSGRQIYLSLRNYAADIGAGGAFPLYSDRENQKGIATTSNEAFQVLLPRYLDDKRPFFNKSSAWCDRRIGGAGFETKVHSGENDWVYVRGLTENSPSRWPLIANAFAPPTTTYVRDPGKPGGVWKGANAIVVWAGGSAEIVETKPQRDGFIIPRSDKPSANAFEKDGEWLVGFGVEVLSPNVPQPNTSFGGEILSEDGGC